MKAWLAGLFIIALLSVMLSVLLGKSKLTKTIQSVLTLMLATALLTPLLSLKTQSFTDIFQEELTSIEDYNSTMQAVKKTYLEEKCAEKLADHGESGTVVLFGDFSSQNKLTSATIYLQNIGINRTEENIVEIRKTIAAFCGLKGEAITVYVGTRQITAS